MNLMQYLENNTIYIVVHGDKNLGPCILERSLQLQGICQKLGNKRITSPYQLGLSNTNKEDWNISSDIGCPSPSNDNVRTTPWITSALPSQSTHSLPGHPILSWQVSTLPTDVQDTQGTMESETYYLLRRNFYELLEQVAGLLTPTTQVFHSILR